MTAVFSFTPPFAEHKVHRNQYWLACAWGMIAIRECPCDSSHQHYDKPLLNTTAVWHLYCTQIQGFLLRRITGFFRLEGSQELLARSRVSCEVRADFLRLWPVWSWKTLHFPHKKGPAFCPLQNYRTGMHIIMLMSQKSVRLREPSTPPFGLINFWRGGGWVS